MKPQFIQAPKHSDTSLYIANEIVPFFYNPFHYHHKLELTYIIKSTGKRFIGNSIGRFEPGELILVGPMLAHCWKNAPEYFENNPDFIAQAIVVHFDLNFLGKPFWNVPEMSQIKELLLQSRHGIFFSKRTTLKIRKDLLNLEKLPESKKIISFLDILNALSLDESKKSLSTALANRSINDKNLERLNKVIDYISHNFTDEVTVKQLSEIAHLTPNAFCRFFKAHTRKTFKTYLNEIRIDYACTLMQEEKIGMADVGYKSGFNNVSHFIRTFKKVKGVLPLKYKKALQTI
ncbi:AraC family transcriptional regulator [Seonamhaeicola marinus]|uniref:Helix-turn-helix transcriptional regulator n=1 Tax=Seonamhaeicola marinus TaxID=1912246 RepID=A0A5D0J3W1_9FLAO|nr:AraC family transcriptional regulator [Seonamhaeicola marinus]TYA89247.1 helix-turn-helix transcriptional regulator [Seonamhaeicola marinus]